MEAAKDDADAIAAKMEELLTFWIERQVDNGVRLDGAAVRSKATSIYERISSCSSSERFTPDDRWLADYKRRYGLHRSVDAVPVRSEITIERELDALVTRTIDQLKEEPPDESRNVYEPCRICLKTKPLHSSIHDLFKEEQLNTIQIIEMVFSVSLLQDGAFPKDLCFICYQELEMAYNFKKRCQASEDILKHRRSNGESVFVEVKDELTENDDMSGRSDDEDSSSRQKCVPFITFNENSRGGRIKCENVSNDNYHCGVNDGKKSTKRIYEQTIRDIKAANKKIKKIKKLNSDRCSKKKKTLSFLKTKLIKEENSKLALAAAAAAATEPTEDRTFPCTLCDRIFPKQSGLRRHQKVHSDVKPFLCDQCHYKCRTSSSLTTHKKHKHSSVKDFKCDECGYAFKTKNSLTVHVIKHTGQKNFACDVCTYRAYAKVNLETHKMVAHSDERPVACAHCPYRTINQKYLDIHMRKHTSVKKFSCGMCPYTAHTTYKMKIHTWIHTGEKPYACDHCDFKTASLSSLNRHRKKAHK